MRYVWNTTKNKVKVQHDGKTWFMEPDEVKEFYFDGDAKCIADVYGIEGIAMLEQNTDAAKKSALPATTLKYYNFLLQQLRDWSSYMDDQRKDGRSMLGIPKRVKELQREVATLEYANAYELSMNDEIYQKLMKEGIIPSEPIEPWVEPLKAAAKGKNKSQHVAAELGA